MRLMREITFAGVVPVFRNLIPTVNDQCAAERFQDGDRVVLNNIYSSKRSLLKKKFHMAACFIIASFFMMRIPIQLIGPKYVSRYDFVDLQRNIFFSESVIYF